MEVASGLTTHQRMQLVRVADVMVPAADGMPAASDIGIADGLVDWVLTALPISWNR